MRPKYYTTNEVAKICSVTKETVREWLRSKKIAGVKKGRQYLISEDELRDYLEEKHG